MRRLPTTRLSAAAVVVLAALGNAHAASAQPAAGQEDAYRALLDRYGRGEFADAAQAAIALDLDSTRRIARDIVEQLEMDIRVQARDGPSPELERLRGERLRRLRLMLLLHTEAAQRTAAPYHQLVIARDTAERLLELREVFARHGPSGQGSPAVTEQREALRLLVRDWYLVVSSHLQALGDLGSLRQHVEAGLGVFKDDPELRLALGWAFEREAEVSIVDRSLVKEIYVADHYHRWRRLLGFAADEYERALDRQPDMPEARLRAARVKALKGDGADTRAVYEEVAASTARTALRYQALLFLAELHERAGDTVAARSAYERALGLEPSAQSPKLALSRLCAIAADQDCARQWLDRSLTETGADRRDPWWEYLAGQATLGHERLVSLRHRGLEQ